MSEVACEPELPPLEIISGTGRVVARVQNARLCRCGHSNNKPFCDSSHLKVGFAAANSSVDFELSAVRISGTVCVKSNRSP